MLLFRKVTLEPAKVAAHAQKSQHKWPIPSVTRDLTRHRTRRKTLRVDGNDATALGIWTDYTPEIHVPNTHGLLPFPM